VNSRRCNLRTKTDKTPSTPKWLTVVRVVRPSFPWGRQVFSASAPVGGTYGYSRCPASRDGCGHRTLTGYARTGGENQAKAEPPTLMSRTRLAPPRPSASCYLFSCAKLQPVSRWDGLR